MTWKRNNILQEGCYVIAFYFLYRKVKHIEKLLLFELIILATLLSLWTLAVRQKNCCQQCASLYGTFVYLHLTNKTYHDTLQHEKSTKTDFHFLFNILNIDSI